MKTYAWIPGIVAVYWGVSGGWAFAADATWTGTTDALWSTTTNWNPSAPTSADRAIFSGLGNGNTTLSLGSGAAISQILFDTATAAAYTLGTSGSQTLTLGTGGGVTVNSSVVNNQSIAAGLRLGDGAAGSFTFTNGSLTRLLTLSASISGGTGGTAGAQTLVVAGAGSTTLAGSLADGGATSVGLTKQDAGTLTLTAANTFSGAATVNSGTLYANPGNAANNRALSYVSGITVNAGGTLRSGVNGLFGYDATQAKPITVNAGGVATADPGADVNVGLVTLNGGTLAGGGNTTGWGSWSFGRAAEKRLLVTEDSTVSAADVVFFGGSTVEVDAGKVLTFSGTIVDSNNGPSALIKTGSGTAILGGSNSYTGGTSVSAGTLRVNGSLAAASAVSVAGGATLGGSGSVGGDVAVLSAGFLSPGNSIGALDVGSANLAGTLLIEYDGANLGAIDRLDVLGGLDLTTATVEFLSLGSPLDDPAYVFASYGTLTGTQFASVLNLPSGYRIDYAYQGSNLALVPVPEPGMLGLVALGSGLALAVLRSRGSGARPA